MPTLRFGSRRLHGREVFLVGARAKSKIRRSRKEGGEEKERRWAFNPEISMNLCLASPHLGFLNFPLFPLPSSLTHLSYPSCSFGVSVLWLASLQQRMRRSIEQVIFPKKDILSQPLCALALAGQPD